MNELKPCPFCGVNEWQYHAHFSGASVFQCEKCGTIVDECVLNTRPIEDALNARIAEISQAVGLITTLKPTMVMDTEHPLDMAKEVAEYVTVRIAQLEAELASRDEELKITDGLLKEATETIGAVIACCTYNSNDDAKIGIYGIDQKAFTRIDQFITHYNDAVSAGKVSVDVKTSTDNNKRSKWKAYVPGWGVPTVNKRYLVKLINDWITIATYYPHVGGGYWKDDRGQVLADGVVSLWKGLEE